MMRFIFRLDASLLLLVPVLVLLNLGTAQAHEIRPALLNITEKSSGLVDVTWKVPMRGDRVLGLQPVFPDRLTQVAEPSSRVIPGAHVQRITLRSDGGSLVGEGISIEGLSPPRPTCCCASSWPTAARIRPSCGRRLPPSASPSGLPGARSPGRTRAWVSITSSRGSTIYGIGYLAAFWTIERVASFLPVLREVRM